MHVGECAVVGVDDVFVNAIEDALNREVVVSVPDVVEYAVEVYGVVGECGFSSDGSVRRHQIERVFESRFSIVAVGVAEELRVIAREETVNEELIHARVGLGVEVTT